MTYRVIAAALVACLTVPTLAAPLPKEKPAEERPYYPLTLGTKWVYSIAEDKEMEVVVAKCETEKGITVGVLETRFDGKTVASETMRVTADGVYRIAINSTKIEPPVCILKLPHKPGTEWTVKSKILEQTITVTLTENAPEKVKVPAGEYEAISVGGSGDVDGSQTVIQNWYAPGVGIVRMVYSIGGNDVTLELKSFKAGKSVDPPAKR